MKPRTQKMWARACRHGFLSVSEILHQIYCCFNCGKEGTKTIQVIVTEIKPPKKGKK